LVGEGCFRGAFSVYHPSITTDLACEQVAMAACPYRSVFYGKLAADPSGGPAVPADKLNEELDKWLAGLDAILKRMAVFYAEGGYGKIF
jgi:hypothetical protein